MKPFVKKHIKTTIALLLLVFIGLFVFRLSYGYQTQPNGMIPGTENTESFHLLSPSSSIRKNYASKKYQQTSGLTSLAVDQKYEKIADIKSFTTQFEAMEKKIRLQIKEYDGLIQFENKSGNNGYRKLNLVIGIPPENFDSIYSRLTTVGKIQSKQITKTDKTNEYKELNAKKTSLEKIRASLIELKSKGGRIDEYMQLENRILEIEQQLQALGVSLGNFDDENEFCTVNVLLSEGKVTEIGIMHRVKVALEWTLKTYIMLMFALALVTLFGYLLLLSIEKIRTQI